MNPTDLIANVPTTLDGAVVLSVAAAAPGQFGDTYDDPTSVPILYFAVAQYLGDLPRAYLFGVNEDHKVLCDLLYDSPEAAAEDAKSSGYVTDCFIYRDT